MFLLILVMNAVLSARISINDSVTLEQYLCYSEITSNTDLVIASSVAQYIVSIDSFCWLYDTSNVTISSDSITQPVNILCHNAGFGFK